MGARAKNARIASSSQNFTNSAAGLGQIDAREAQPNRRAPRARCDSEIYKSLLEVSEGGENSDRDLNYNTH